jgi:hypothetical protein
MASEEQAFIRRYDEYVKKDRKSKVPIDAKGVYALLKKRRGGKFDVVHVGVSASGIRDRLRQHARNQGRKGQWDYFSVFDVQPYVSSLTIEQLEELWKHIYRKGTRTNSLSLQQGLKKSIVKRTPIEEWDPRYSLQFSSQNQRVAQTAVQTAASINV